ncbi:MAG: phosphate signaling complex protein PhoU [Nitrospirota bacterium]
MTIFDTELRQLKENILMMASLVEDSIKDSIKSLLDRDSELAREVIIKDHQINALDVKIDEECIRLIALRQPTAGDLRFITTAMKITTELERMGDLAENICERALELNEEPLLKPYENIPKIAKIVQAMLMDVIHALLSKDTSLAYDVIKRDDEVDDLTVRNFNELLFIMIQDPKTVPIAVKRTYIAKYLERVADHATNIAEMVIYMTEGKIIRHMEISESE